MDHSVDPAALVARTVLRLPEIPQSHLVGNAQIRESHLKYSPPLKDPGFRVLNRSVSKREHLKIEGMLDKIRKTRNVNIRISEAVLEQLKRRSQEEGIPYQTLRSSIPHKFVADRLVDEKTIRRSTQLLSSSR